MAQPPGLLYSKDHEWVKLDGDVATVGITDYAQASLGDIVYVELPRVGATLAQFGNIGVVESVKAVSDIFTPLGGEVLEVNARARSRSGARQSRAVRRGLALSKLRLGDDGEKNAELDSSARTTTTTLTSAEA